AVFRRRVQSPAEEAHGREIEGAELEIVTPGLKRVFGVAGSEVAVCREGAGALAVNGELELSAAGLLQVEDLESGARGSERDGLSGGLRGDGDAAEPLIGVAAQGHGSFGFPAGSIGAGGIEAAISAIRMASLNEA